MIQASGSIERAGGLWMNGLRVPYLHEGKQTEGIQEHMCMGRFRLKPIGTVHSDITFSKISGCWAVCSTLVRSQMFTLV